MSEHQPIVEEITYCEVHPNRETSLRCNKCGRLMCTECAVLTPVGYRCRECVRQHEDKFYNANQYDYAIVFAVCAVLTGIGAVIASAVGFLLLIIILGIPIGGAIGEAALRLTQRRRGRYSAQIGAAGAVVGGITGGVIRAYVTYAGVVGELARRFPGRELPPLNLTDAFTGVVTDISLLIFIGIVAFVVYGRFKMRM